jgi:hypothetical protein
VVDRDDVSKYPVTMDENTPARVLMLLTLFKLLIYPTSPRPCTVDTILDAKLAVLTYPADPRPCVLDTKFGSSSEVIGNPFRVSIPLTSRLPVVDRDDVSKYPVTMDENTPARVLMLLTLFKLLIYPTSPRPLTVDTILDARLAVLTYPWVPRAAREDTRLNELTYPWVPRPRLVDTKIPSSVFSPTGAPCALVVNSIALPFNLI